MARSATAVEMLVESAGTVDELVELLRLSGCLTVRGRANRSMVVAMMTRARDDFEPPFSVGHEEPDAGHSCPGPWDAIEETLTRGGYLQLAGWPDAYRHVSDSDVKKRVQRTIDEARAARDVQAPADSCWLNEAADIRRRERRLAFEVGPIRCPECRRQLPDGVPVCVWCGVQLPYICACEL